MTIKTRDILKRTSRSVCLTITILLTLLVIILNGCDSDSASKVQTNPKGEFWAVTYDSEPSATLSSMNFNGYGIGLMTELLKPEGDLESEFFTYTTERDGSLAVTALEAGAKDQGIVSYDYSALATITTYPNISGKAGVKVGIRRSSKESNADAEGDYLVVFYESEPSSTLYAMSFDGKGNGTYRQIYNSKGDFLEGTLVYSVKADGSLAIFFDSGGAMSGILNSDLGLFNLFGSNQSKQNMGIGVGIQKYKDMQDGFLTGDYVAIDYKGGIGSGLLRVSFDGNGSGTLGAFDGSGSWRGSQENLTYTVDGDGTLTVTTETGKVTRGIVSYDGSICATVDTDSSDSEIGISIYILEATWFEDKCLDACKEEYTHETEIEDCYEGCLSYMTGYQNNRKVLFKKDKKDACDYSWRSYCWAFYNSHNIFKMAGAYAGYLIDCAIRGCTVKNPFSCPTPHG